MQADTNAFLPVENPRILFVTTALTKQSRQDIFKPEDTNGISTSLSSAFGDHGPSTDSTNPPHYCRRPTVDTSATRSNGEDRLKVEPFGLRPVNSHSVAPLGFNNRGARATKRKGTIAYAVDINGWIE
ncbi:hypothetical protein TNIN_4731 [Trichonephila inaurata madagascariensis]|uniref:Uncharacterized protein n=1 Tax=Trichonephila inaurata madagascariensis TaxID=2747483 RepID=A0A8X6YKE9_9ARAC|nr:hypothetical protein TNIN_4731 [Trichonephila inaurata madagascariensis]